MVTISNLVTEEFPVVMKLFGVTGGSMAVCTVTIPSLLDNEVSEAEITEAVSVRGTVSFLQAVKVVKSASVITDRIRTLICIGHVLINNEQ